MEHLSLWLIPAVVPVVGYASYHLSRVVLLWRADRRERRALRVR